MKIQTVFLLLVLQSVFSVKVGSKSRVHLKAKSHLHLHSKSRSLLRLHKRRQDAANAAADAAAAKEKDKQIQDAQKIDPVLSKAASGLYPFYPRVYNISAEDEPVIMFTQDTNAKGESLLNRHDLDYDEQCVLKQGYLAQVLSVNTKQSFTKNDTDKGVEQTFITMRPVFTVLNKQTLSIFENENVDGLLYSIPLTKIPSSCVYPKWKSTFCFSVVEGDNSIPLKTDFDFTALPSTYNKHNIKLTLCATLSSVRDSWANAINTFHNCEVKSLNVVKEDNKDFMKTIKDQDEDYEQERENASDEQILEIGGSLDSINDKVRANLNIITSSETDENNKINDEDGQIDALEEKNECLQEQLIEESLASAQNLQWDLEKAMTDQVKKAVNPDKLDDLYKNRLYRIIQHKQNQIKERKRIENNINSEMMSKMQQVNKNSDATACYGENIVGSLDAHIKDVCSSIFKNAGYTLIIKDLMDCLNQDTFCMACCSNFIGTAKLEKRNKCIDKCAFGQKAILDKTQLKLSVETDNGVSKNDLHVDEEKIKALESGVTS